MVVFSILGVEATLAQDLKLALALSDRQDEPTALWGDACPLA